MAITLSQETLALIEQRASESGCLNVDEFIQAMLVEKYPSFEVDMAKLDPETRAAIDEGQREIDAGLGIPWEVAEARLRDRFGKA
jgi:hypothetical protein